MTTQTIETALTPITQAQRMLAEAKTLPELRELRDFATGAKAWAKARGIGIGAENEATEVILRAEREIGKNLIFLREQGAFGKEAAMASIGRQFGGVPLAGRSGVRADEQDVVTLDNLGIKRQESSDFQRLASLPDDKFESMIHAIRAIEGARLAKANFYKAVDKADRKRRGVEDALPTPPNEDFDTFRRGAYALLGWEVDEDGVGTSTKNGLFALPNDELMQLATLVKALAVAFNEVRVARA